MMMKKTSPTTYAHPLGLKKAAKSSAAGVLSSWPIVGGKAMIEAGKITGITPAMLTRSGREGEPPAGRLRPPPRHVPAERRVGRAPGRHPPADDALRVLDRDPALALLHEHDPDDHRQRD